MLRVAAGGARPNVEAANERVLRRDVAWANGWGARDGSVTPLLSAQPPLSLGKRAIAPSLISRFGSVQILSLFQTMAEKTDGSVAVKLPCPSLTRTTIGRFSHAVETMRSRFLSPFK